jgi:hypothetical protein
MLDVAGTKRGAVRVRWIHVVEVRDAPDRPALEYVFIANRR